MMNFKIGSRVCFDKQPEDEYRIEAVLLYPDYSFSNSINPVDISVDCLTDELVRFRIDRLRRSILEQKTGENIYVLRSIPTGKLFVISELELCVRVSDESYICSAEADEQSYREKCLNEAKHCVCGDRDHQYGRPENNFRIIAEYWSTYLAEKMCVDKLVLNSDDVANMMCLFKLGRLTTAVANERSFDSYVDLAGYAACGAEIISHRKAGDDKWQR